MIGAGGALWLWIVYEPDRPLESDWDALVITLAGGGAADSRPQTPYQIHFSDPFGITATPDGTIYVADGVGAHRIYRITSAGFVTILAGSDPGFADGPGPSARFRTPSGLAADAAG